MANTYNSYVGPLPIVSTTAASASQPFAMPIGGLPGSVTFAVGTQPFTTVVSSVVATPGYMFPIGYGGLGIPSGVNDLTVGVQPFATVTSGSPAGVSNLTAGLQPFPVNTNASERWTFSSFVAGGGVAATPSTGQLYPLGRN